MYVTLEDIPAASRTKEYIMSKYNVSNTTAWRLLSGRAAHICPAYHVRETNIAENGWELVVSPEITRHIRNCIVHQLRVWGKSLQHLDDISQECLIRAYEKSGIWSVMPENKKKAYLATLAIRTANDYLKKYVCYTDNLKHDVCNYDNICNGMRCRYDKESGTA